MGASPHTLDGTAAPPPPPVTYTGPQLQSVQEGTTTYARYGGFNALGQPSTLTLGNVTGLTDARHGNQTFNYDAARKK